MGKILRTPGLRLTLSEMQDGASQKFDPSEPIQIIRCGSFFYFMDEKFEITPETLQNMKRNFDNNVRGVDIALDFSHKSDLEAAGWFKEIQLKNNDTELWAVIDWTPTGAKKVADKDYRYLSADFSFDYLDNETNQQFGPLLYGAGLTNRPFVKNMAPATQLSEERDESMTDKERIAELETENASLKAQASALPAKDAELAASKTELEAAKAEVLTLSEKVKKSEDAIKLAEKEGVFTKLLSEGKAVPAQKEAFMSGDALKFAELAQPVKLSTAGHGGEGGESEAASVGDVNKQIMDKAKALKMSDLGLAVKKVLSENKELADQYYAANKVK